MTGEPGGPAQSAAQSQGQGPSQSQGQPHSPADRPAPAPRRPGELLFTGAMALGSALLLWNAYGIAGFEALSSPGAVPMAVTAVMLLSAAVIFLQALRKAPPRGRPCAAISCRRW